ncbi:hypothetical protein N5C66_23125 [Rhizobium pusense]|jgi:hypothetical protein|uniref:Uncharacterized protein n=4 Tax=Hyphomicrobiales TaxID=356 RepID=A0A1L9CFW8_9HYPH|nr:MULTISPECIES: hypothetical protein [Rhizobium/Agrobacterium group]AMD59316.1 hypothetical protein AWN88_13640 [Agrobacterium tumefaciens]ANV23066.1 hypothetical protein BA939_03385 [Rhizobium sp. S41]AUC09881.1 hypothetical protein BLX90_06540 [Rhizobium sp. Y9]EKJ95393.1 hypothetical protein C241_13567 [Bradyrhizobium lupini HPC(L)]KGE80239.1 hypothetical protein LW14_24375 [Rhizobium sp. H41]KIV68343.1 hypothetical protein SZ54_1020 [Rhizobium sp. UR51a]MBB2905205.1 hypothetical protein
MKTALVLMTFLGCDDSATDCHYLATSQQRWTSIELCDAVSEKELERFANASYPVVVAVCQTPGEQSPQTAGTQSGTPAPADAQQATAEVTPKEEESLTKQAIGRVSRVLPSTEGIKHFLGTPVRMVENSYSWIAKRFDK